MIPKQVPREDWLVMGDPISQLAQAVERSMGLLACQRTAVRERPTQRWPPECHLMVLPSDQSGRCGLRDRATKSRNRRRVRLRFEVDLMLDRCAPPPSWRRQGDPDIPRRVQSQGCRTRPSRSTRKRMPPRVRPGYSRPRRVHDKKVTVSPYGGIERALIVRCLGWEDSDHVRGAVDGTAR